MDCEVFLTVKYDTISLHSTAQHTMVSQVFGRVWLHTVQHTVYFKRSNTRLLLTAIANPRVVKQLLQSLPPITAITCAESPRPCHCSPHPSPTAAACSVLSRPAAAAAIGELLLSPPPSPPPLSPSNAFLAPLPGVQDALGPAAAAPQLQLPPALYAAAQRQWLATTRRSPLCRLSGYHPYCYSTLPAPFCSPPTPQPPHTL